MKKAKKKTARKAKTYGGPSLGRRLRKEAKTVQSKGRVIFVGMRTELGRLSPFDGPEIGQAPRTLGVEGGWTHDLIQAEAHRDLTAMGRTFVTPGFLSGRSTRFTARPSF